MATANPLVVTPDPVPDGQVGVIAVSFVTDPGTPDETSDVELKFNGGTVVSVSAVLQGKPAEAVPPVSIGSTGVGWEIQASVGTLVQTAENTFSIGR